MLNVTTEPSSVTRRIFPTMEEAERAASREVAATGAQMLPAIMFRQGERTMLTTAFLIAMAKNRLQASHAQKRGSVEEVRAATNRPLMDDHVNSVKNYLKANVGKKYVLPPLTLNARQPLSIYLADFGSTMQSVWLVIPPSVKLEITDGGHRKAAIDQALEELSDEQADILRNDAVAVMITIESDLAQIHQDFADASKTKALPKSQLAAYDRRNPANGIVLDLIDDCRIFSGRVDSTSKTLSKLSNKLFLTNQVRQMVKELLVGSYALADEQFEERATSILVAADTPQYVRERERFSSFIDQFTDAIPVLRNIASMDNSGFAGERVRDLREEGWVCLMATGLVIMGRIGYLLFKHDVDDWQDYVRRMGQLDWRKSGELWQGNIIRDGKVMTQQVPVKLAVSAVRNAIGLTDEALGIVDTAMLDDAA